MASPAALYRFGESWCDTTTDAGRLMLTIMGGIAEFERGLIRLPPATTALRGFAVDLRM
jgi:hypothetical protein